MESSDERATAHLIAERTLALAADAQSGEGVHSRPRYVLAGLGLLFAAAAVLAGYFLFFPSSAPPPGKGQGPGAVAVANGALDPAESGDAGIVNCNSWPSAKVYLDGRRLLGTTPKTGIRVPAGTHVLLFVSKDGSLRKEVNVTLEKGETRTLAVSLDR